MFRSIRITRLFNEMVRYEGSWMTLKQIHQLLFPLSEIGMQFGVDTEEDTNSFTPHPAM